MPILTLPGGLTAPIPQVSDMPHSSAISMPIAWKNSSTSTGVGAAPTLTVTTSSSPSIVRRPENISLSALATVSARSAGTSSPACSRRSFFSAAWSASSTGLRCSSSWPATIASSPALSFSQMRGTAKNQFGWTSGRNCTIVRGSGQAVTCPANTTGK